MFVSNLKNDEVVLFNEIKVENNKYSLIDKTLSENTAQYNFQFWESGNINIPPFIIRIKESNHNIIELKSNKLTLNIKSNISNPNNGLRDIKQMKDVKLTSILSNIIYISFILFGIFIFVFVRRRYIKHSLNTSSQSINYQNLLQQSLKDIDSLSLPKKINSETTEYFYLKLSEIFRRFIKDQFYIKATEMTSQELSDHFKKIGIENKLIVSWINFTKKVDLAKYAKYVPPINEYNEDKINFKNLIKSFDKIVAKSI